MVIRMLLRVVLATVVLSAAPDFGFAGPCGASPNERLYLMDGAGSILVTYDPVTLERLSIQSTGHVQFTTSLTYGQGRLFAIENNHGITMDLLLSLHPASALASAVGPTGISYSTFPSIKYDPTRDEFFVLYQEFTTPAEVWYPTLYRIDPDAGQMTYISRVNVGQPPFHFFPLAMAVSHTGEAVVAQPGIGPSLRRLHLESGQLAPLGQLGIGTGQIRDMSFDASGRIWTLYDDWLDNTKDGIYTVDPVALTFEPKLLTKDFPLSGMNAIAVVPLPAMSAYCEPSSGTTCAPTIDWKGLPSATADSGFPVRVRGTPSGSTGLMLFGNGAQGPPFQGSTLCFGPPYLLSAPAPSVPSGTGSACDGTWSIDLNPEILAAGFQPGDTLHAQWMGLDPAAQPGAPRVTSNALMFELAP